MLTVRAFGSLDIRGDHGASLSSLLAQPKRSALLAYLVLARPGQLYRRDALLALFWPESDQHHGRNALSQALSFLRREVGPGLIVRRGAEEVGVTREAVKSDVEAFTTALSDGRWSDALAIYGGDLLEGFHVVGGAPFVEWIDRERDRLRAAAADAGWRQAHQRLAAGDVGGAESAAHRALELAPTDEVRVRRFILSLTRVGDRAAAVRFYEEFCGRLREELELDPSPATAELAEKIRNGDVTVPGWDADLSASLAAEHGPAAAPARGPPLGASVGDGSPGRPRRWPWWAAAAVACAALLYALPVPRVADRATASSPDPPFTVVAEVAGGAGDVDREAVAFLLRFGLDAARVVRTVPDAEIHRTLELMEREPDAVMEGAVARQVATRLGVGTVVLPRLDRFGERYVLSLRVVDAREDLLIAQARGSAGSHAEVVEMIDDVLLDLRRKLGESNVVLAASEPLPRVLTPSLEALEQYRIGRQLIAEGSARAAVAHLRRAVALDTAFAMAWLSLGVAYGNFLAMPDSGAYAGQKVRQFRDRLTDARRADQELHRRMAQDVASWDVGLEDGERAVLRDPTWISNYAEYVATVAGRPDSALDMRLRREARWAAEARRFDPSAPYTTNCYIHSIYWAAALDRVEELRALLDSLGSELPADCDRELALYERLGAADWSVADSLGAALPQVWRWPRSVDIALRQLEPLRGRIGAAYRRQEPPSADKSTASQGGWTEVSHLLLELLYGVRASDAVPPDRRDAEPPMLQGRGRVAVTHYVLHGVREALVGDTVESKRVSLRLRAMRDSATSRTFERTFAPWFTLMDVGPAWRRGDWRAVVHRLGPLASQLDRPGTGTVAGDRYIIHWLLADAHAHLGDPRSAVAHLEAMLQRPTARLQDWTLQGFVHPAVRFRLARLYTWIGDEARAGEQYRAFLDLFTDPEPEYAWMVGEAERALGIAPRR